MSAWEVTGRGRFVGVGGHVDVIERRRARRKRHGFRGVLGGRRPGRAGRRRGLVVFLFLFRRGRSRRRRKRREEEEEEEEEDEEEDEEDEEDEEEGMT